MSYISRPGIVPNRVEERRYQTTMAEACLSADTLLILPTGLGKTIVALYVAAATLGKGEKVLVLAPTKPLVDQHSKVFSDLLDGASVGVMNGLMKPEARGRTMEECDLVVSTPQSVANDLESGRYTLDGFGLVIYDEAHRGTGNYAYVTVAEHCGPGIRSLGLTASPGSDLSRIEEICRNLSFDRIDMRSDGDPDVAPYVHDTYINRIEVNMPEDLLSVIQLMKGMLDHYFQELKNLHLAEPNWPVSTTHMLTVGESLRRRLKRGERTAVVFRGLAVQSICMKLLHAISLAETQGMSSLRAYMSRIGSDPGSGTCPKGEKELASREEFQEIRRIVSETKVEHPKVSRIMSLVSQILNSGRGSKAIVFTQYRDTCDLLAGKLSAIPGARVGKLIGQSNGGLKQKEQIGILDDFRNGRYNVIVSTSVGEEGLDITSTDAVIFYEPIPSEIRTIQRRGRTGRKNDGEVFILIAKGTMDEVSEKTSNRKEELMRTRLEKLNDELMRRNAPASDSGQTRLGDFR